MNYKCSSIKIKFKYLISNNNSNILCLMNKVYSKYNLLGNYQMSLKVIIEFNNQINYIRKNNKKMKKEFKMNTKICI